jgi:nitrate/nitrite-specific signal transduction histidine kinase
MRERALLVDGSLEIDSSPGKGTTVKLFVPTRHIGAAADRDPAVAVERS